MAEGLWEAFLELKLHSTEENISGCVNRPNLNHKSPGYPVNLLYFDFESYPLRSLLLLLGRYFESRWFLVEAAWVVRFFVLKYKSSRVDIHCFHFLTQKVFFDHRQNYIDQAHLAKLRLIFLFTLFICGLLLVLGLRVNYLKLFFGELRRRRLEKIKFKHRTTYAFK